MLTSWLVDRHFKTLLLEGKQSPPGTLHDNSCGSGSSSPTPDESQAVLNPVLRCHTISRLSLAVLSPVDTLFTAVQNVVFHTQLSLRKKNQSSSPTRDTTIRTATMKKMTVAILLGNGSKKEAR
jgi:hypothetical protein